MRNAMRGSQFIIVRNSHTEVLERALYFSAHTQLQGPCLLIGAKHLLELCNGLAGTV